MELKDFPLEVLVSMSADINKEISKKRYVTNYKNKPTSLLITNHKKTRGSKNKNAKLTEQDIISIRRRYLAGESQKIMADEYKVRRATIGDIINGRSWFYVKELKKEVEEKYLSSKKVKTNRKKLMDLYEQIALDMCLKDGVKIWNLNYLEIAKKAGRTWDCRNILMRDLRKKLEFKIYAGYNEKEPPLIKHPRREFIKSCFITAAVKDAKRHGIWSVETLPLEHEVKGKFYNYFKNKDDLLSQIEFYVYSGYKND